MRRWRGEKREERRGGRWEKRKKETMWNKGEGEEVGETSTEKGESGGGEGGGVDSRRVHDRDTEKP